jgi:hypothetical protein
MGLIPKSGTWEKLVQLLVVGLKDGLLQHPKEPLTFGKPSE